MRRSHILVAIVCFAAITVRLIPLAYSSLPYNIDGFSIVNITERTQVSGFLNPLPDDPNLPNYKVPFFPVLLTILSDVLGVEPLLLAQVVIPVLILPAILGMFALMRRLTKNDAASMFAALFMALEGMYVFFTATVIKVSIAFVLMPIIFSLYWNREDRRKRALAAFLLIMLPWVHHLSALLTYVAISFILINDLLGLWRIGNLTWRRFAMEMALGPALFIPGLLHYNSVNLMYLREVDDARQIVLFFSVFLIFAFVHRTLSLPRRPKNRNRAARRSIWRAIFDNKLIYPVGAVVLLIVNYQSNIFAGTIQTKPALFVALVPYVLLIMICLIGFNLIRHFDNRFRSLAMALFVAPFSIMVFAFLRGLDPLSFMILFRSYVYLDFGLAICAGIGIAFLLTLRRSRALKSVLVVGFIVLLLMSLPLGLRSEEMYDVENATAQYEFRAMSHVDFIGAKYVGSDQRMLDIFESYFHGQGGPYLPDEINQGADIGQYDFVLLLDSWTTLGAQRFPMPNLMVDQQKVDQLASNNNVIYAISSPIGGAIIVRVR